jgi:ABC-type transporter Mla subunit MlaD
MNRLQPRRVAIGAVLLVLVSACGNIQERSMCRQYEDVRAVADELRALDPATATTTDLLELLDDALVELDQLQATTEGLYDQTISTIRTNLLEFRQVTFDLGEETLEVLRPLYAESRDRTVTAYQLLEQRLDVVCNVG